MIMVLSILRLDIWHIPQLKERLDEKIKVAFIKFCGMATGGTEKVLQIIAANLPKDKFGDFYYCDSAPYIGSDFIHPDNDPSRKNIVVKMESI